MLFGMTCPDCGSEFKRICRVCQARRAYQGLLLHQRRFLQTWLLGAIDLRVRNFDGATHLELFDDRWHAYCGAPLFTPRADWARIVTERRRQRDLPADLCAACRKIFDELVAKAGSEVNNAR